MGFFRYPKSQDFEIFIANFKICEKCEIPGFFEYWGSQDLKVQIQDSDFFRVIGYPINPPPLPPSLQICGYNLISFSF